MSLIENTKWLLANGYKKKFIEEANPITELFLARKNSPEFRNSNKLSIEENKYFEFIQYPDLSIFGYYNEPILHHKIKAEILFYFAVDFEVLLIQSSIINVETIYYSPDHSYSEIETFIMLSF